MVKRQKLSDLKAPTCWCRAQRANKSMTHRCSACPLPPVRNKLLVRRQAGIRAWRSRKRMARARKAAPSGAMQS